MILTYRVLLKRADSTVESTGRRPCCKDARSINEAGAEKVQGSV
jgi:hypothetical protein